MKPETGSCGIVEAAMDMAKLRLQFATAALLLSAAPALAGDGNADKFEIPLGEIPHFADEASARAACAPDPVVWADRKTGFFYPKFFSEYGKTAHGAYTCLKQAKDADYWSLAPESEGHKGREFPQFFCYTCS
jgi:hypothetical protein